MHLRAAVIVFAGILVYGNSINAPFMFDDQTAIVDNPRIRQWWPPSIPLTPPRDTPVAGRPLVNASFAINYALGGLDVAGYHLGNLAIHLLAALVLFGLVRRTLLLPRLAMFAPQSTNIAFASALLWALHPLQTEVMNYLAQRSESLMGLSYLFTLYASLRAHESGSRRWAIGAVATCAAGMACKESMATAPIMVLLFDRVFLFESWREMMRRRGRFQAALTATWLVLATLMAMRPRTSIGFAAGTDAWTYFLNQLEIIPRYLALVVWPRALVLDYGLPRAIELNEVLLSGLFLSVLGTSTIIALVYRPMIGFLGAWFFVTLAPASSFVPVATEVGAERRMYLPLAALVVLAVIAVMRIRTRPAVAWSALAAVSLLLAAGTIARNREFRSRLTIAETIVERRPHGRGHFILASELLNTGNTARAIEHFRLSTRDYAPAHYGLGTELVALGQLEEGITHLREFIRQRPDDSAVAPARDLLGRALAAQGDERGAVEQFNLILEENPRDPRALEFLGDVRLRQGQPEEAIRAYEASLAVRPANINVLRNLGLALASSGRGRDAIPIFRRAVSAAPGNASLHVLLGRALAADGQFAEAATIFRRAAELAPGDPDVARNLAAIERVVPPSEPAR